MQVETSSENPGVADWLAKRGVAETLVCAIAFLIYVPTLGFQFVYDDKPQIIQNPAIHAWRYLPRYFTAHAWAELYPNVAGNYYRPLFLLWFRLNHMLFGLEPEGWHLTTVLCHVAATYLVFRLVGRLAASHWIAFSAAVLFALHPVHLESVAWVSGVTDPLLTIFMIGSFLAYLSFRQQKRWLWMALALNLFALGLLEKETIVILGPLIFVYAWLYNEDRSWVSMFATSLKQSVPFFGLTAIYLGLRAHVLHGLSHSVTPVAWSTMALTVPSIVWMYFRHFLFPVGLSGLYGLPYVEYAGSSAFVVPLVLLILLILILAWGISRLEDRRLALFACFWMVLPIVPVLFLRAYAEGDIAHDRYLYIPSIGFALLVSLCLKEIGNNWPAGRKKVQIGGLVILALFYATATMTQETYWASDLILYGRAYKIAPHDNLICNDLGAALMDAGNSQEAGTLYSQVLAREPGFWLSNYNLGYTYYKIGKFSDAEALLRRAISINAADSDEYIYLGLSVWRQGRADEAVQYIQRALQIRPSGSGYHFVLAMIYRDQGNIPGAREEFIQEMQYHPENTAARQQLDALPSGAAPAPN
jgi:tetratricopeptide (TPR) repeat protein